MRGHLFRGAAVIAALSLATPPLASAQTTEPTEQTEATTLSAEHLDAMLAPIALYPDTLLVQILMASTFPLQVVEASRWLEQPDHKGLQGDALAQALEAVNWDPSVKSLVPFPQVLATLNSQLEWMQQVGYAFATQQADVMAACSGCGTRRRRAAVWRRPGSSASPRRTAPSPSSLPARKPSTCRSTIRPRSTAPGRIRGISRC